MCQSHGSVLNPLWESLPSGWEPGRLDDGFDTDSPEIAILVNKALALLKPAQARLLEAFHDDPAAPLIGDRDFFSEHLAHRIAVIALVLKQAEGKLDRSGSCSGKALH